jgi:dihydrolipoamide dehydrogenase
MVVGEIPERVDLLVVGAGPGGYVAAIRGAQLGRSVVLVDSKGAEGVGGVCLNVGCIPSKALIEVAVAVNRLRTLSNAGITATTSVDLQKWQEHRLAIVRSLGNGIRSQLSSLGVTLVEGELRFTRPSQAIVETPEGQAKFFEFTDVIIATGSRPAQLTNLPRDGEQILNSTDALGLTQIPTSLAVIGGGYIGLELGTAFAKLGATVTIIEVADSLLPGMPARIVRPVMNRLKELGVSVFTGATADGYDGKLLQISQGEERMVAADRVIVAVGRSPNTDDLGLDRLGVSPDGQGLLNVGLDRRLSRHIAAIGDITPGPMLAHKASAEAHIAVEALCGLPAQYSPMAVPMVVYSDPEIALAGLTESEAREEGIDLVTPTIPIGSSGRAATMSSKFGHMRILADRDTHAVLGVQVVGPHASELISEGVLAIEMGATLEDLAAVIHPHPTLSEQYQQAAQLGLAPSPISPTARRTIKGDGLPSFDRTDDESVERS